MKKAKATAASPTGRMRTAFISDGWAGFSEDMMLMCERFQLVEVFADQRVAQ